MQEGVTVYCLSDNEAGKRDKNVSIRIRRRSNRSLDGYFRTSL